MYDLPKGLVVNQSEFIGKDFIGQDLFVGDFVIKANRTSTQAYLTYARIVGALTPGKYMCSKPFFHLVSYDNFFKKFGKPGRAERLDLLIKLADNQVPEDIKSAYDRPF